MPPVHHALYDYILHLTLSLSQLQYSLCADRFVTKQQKTNAQVLNPHALMQMAQDLTGGKSSETLTI